MLANSLASRIVCAVSLDLATTELAVSSKRRSSSTCASAWLASPMANTVRTEKAAVTECVTAVMGRSREAVNGSGSYLGPGPGRLGKVGLGAWGTAGAAFWGPEALGERPCVCVKMARILTAERTCQPCPQRPSQPFHLRVLPPASSCLVCPLTKPPPPPGRSHGPRVPDFTPQHSTTTPPRLCMCPCSGCCRHHAHAPG